jgi:hypothetical protein
MDAPHGTKIKLQMKVDIMRVTCTCSLRTDIKLYVLSISQATRSWEDHMGISVNLTFSACVYPLCHFIILGMRWEDRLRKPGMKRQNDNEC